MVVLTSGDTVWAALYAWVSTTDQGIIRQHEANLAACERYGWIPVEYDDPRLSASRFAKRDGGSNRQEWRRLLADLTAGKIDVLVLWEPSRGDRQLTGWLALLDACRKHGVRVLSRSDPGTPAHEVGLGPLEDDYVVAGPMQERRCRASGDRSPDNADPHACGP